jgi:hypothetical protein
VRYVAVIICAMACARSANADPVLLVANWSGSLGEYNLDGTTVNAALIPNVGDAGGIAVSGSDIFITGLDTGTIKAFTTSGATVNTSLVSGLNFAGAQTGGIAVSGSTIFMTTGFSYVSAYTTSGAAINTGLITGLAGASAIAVSGSDLFVTQIGNSTLGEYTTSGGTVNA